MKRIIAVSTRVPAKVDSIVRPRIIASTRNEVVTKNEVLILGLVALMNMPLEKRIRMA